MPTYNYRFKNAIDLDQVADALLLATAATEGLHGRSRVRLEARFRLDRRARSCRVDASTEVGQDLARIFTGLLNQQFGEATFQVGPCKGVRGRDARG